MPQWVAVYNGNEAKLSPICLSVALAEPQQYNFFLNWISFLTIFAFTFDIVRLSTLNDIKLLVSLPQLSFLK